MQLKIRQIQSKLSGNILRDLSRYDLECIYNRFNTDQDFTFEMFMCMAECNETDGIIITSLASYLKPAHNEINYAEHILPYITDVCELSVLVVGQDVGATVDAMQMEGACCAGYSLDNMQDALELIDSSDKFDILISLYNLQSTNNMRDVIEQFACLGRNIILIDFETDTIDQVRFYQDLCEGILDTCEPTRRGVTNSIQAAIDRMSRCGLSLQKHERLRLFQTSLYIFNASSS